MNIQRGESLQSDGTKKNRVKRVIESINMAKQKLEKFGKDVSRVSIPKVYMRLYLNSDKTYNRKGAQK